MEIQAGVNLGNLQGYSRIQVLSESRSRSVIKPNAALLSDTMLYSFPIADLIAQEAHTSLSRVTNWCYRELCERHIGFLKKGILLRGSIVVGNLHNTNNYAYGEGVAFAAYKEKMKCAPGK